MSMHPVFGQIVNDFQAIPEKIATASGAEGSAPPESDAELAARLMRFYSVETLEQLVRAQNKHVEKLQIYGAPRLGSDVRRTPREG